MKAFLKINLIICICLLTVGSVFAQGAALSRISVDGNQFITEDGEVIVFRGLNTSDPDKLAKDGHWNKAYFDEIKKWGANIVRFPVHPVRMKERGQEEYLKLLDQGIQWAAENGLYVIIDWHSIGNLRSQLYQAPMYETTQKETFEFWRTIGRRYGNNPTVAFYELYNEPTTFNGQLGTCTWTQWKELMEEMIVIVRANGGQGIPLVGGFNWAYDLTPVLEDPIDADGIAYVSHPYPQKRPKPWAAQWTKDWGFVKEKYPVMLTEIGFCLPDERGAHVPVISDVSYGHAITNYCDGADISYVAWVFDPQWAPSLFDDWNFTTTTQGQFFKEKLQSYPADGKSVKMQARIGVGALAPPDAEVLFDGTRPMLDEKWTYWNGPRLAATLPIKWAIEADPVDDGMVMNSNDPAAAGGKYGAADIVTKKKYRDFRVHVEFLIKKEGGNSGVYLQNRYEIQVLDGDKTKHGMGAVINETESPYHAYNGVGKWNAYDIVFRAARFENGQRTEKAMVTLYFNGQKVHSNQTINQVWGGPNSGIDGGNDGGKGITDTPGGLKLQAEGHDVLYRNIWIKELDLKKADTDF